jgi:hypothetical protein
MTGRAQLLHVKVGKRSSIWIGPLHDLRQVLLEEANATLDKWRWRELLRGCVVSCKRTHGLVIWRVARNDGPLSQPLRAKWAAEIEQWRLALGVPDDARVRSQIKGKLVAIAWGFPVGPGAPSADVVEAVLSEAIAPSDG